MPIVNILVTREGTTPGADRTTAAQKAAVYQGSPTCCSRSSASPAKTPPSSSTSMRWRISAEAACRWPTTAPGVHRTAAQAPDADQHRPIEATDQRGACSSLRIREGEHP